VNKQQEMITIGSVSVSKCNLKLSIPFKTMLTAFKHSLQVWHIQGSKVMNICVKTMKWNYLDWITCLITETWSMVTIEVFKILIPIPYS
jgi:hypothetical protein